MITNLHHHSPLYPQQLQDLAALIIERVQPEKIICYGSRIRNIEAWSCFLQPIRPQVHAVYDLLIITREKDKHNSHEIVDKIERCQTTEVRFNAVVHTVTAVKEALKNKSHFFTALINTGVLLYDKMEAPLITTQEKGNINDGILKIMILWNKWFCQGQQFLQGASYFSSAGFINLCVFMLHQAVEHTSAALITVCTGYRPATHNLNRLLSMTENFTARLLPIFPRNTREEIDLFNTLARAYSDARYKDGYQVNGGKINVLIERVKAFQDEAEKIYNDQLAQIKNFGLYPSVNDVQKPYEN